MIPEPEGRRFEAYRALKRAQGDKEESEERLTKAKRLAQEVEKVKKNNHFSEGLRRAYRGR